MVRKTFIALLLSMSLAAFTPVDGIAVTVTLDVLDDFITVGESFDVKVQLDGEGIGNDLLSFGFDVDDSSAYFRYTGYDLNHLSFF